MTSTVFPGRLRQAVVVLSVLAGLFGMHGAMSGHGALATSPAAMSSLTEPPPDLPPLTTAALGNASTDATSTTEPTMLRVPEAATGSLAFTAPGSAMTGMLLTCLAILSGGLVLGLLRFLRGRRRLSFCRDRSASPGSWLLSRAGRLASPPDLVAGLCVSRT